MSNYFGSNQWLKNHPNPIELINEPDTEIYHPENLVEMVERIKEAFTRYKRDLSEW